jgi:hypothetical protein
MKEYKGLSQPFQPDWQGLIDNIRRKGTPRRVHHIELFHDVDFICRSDEASIRARVRDTLDKCLPGGGYCLGTGNSVTNYIPVDNYLAMIDEGRLYG